MGTIKSRVLDEKTLGYANMAIYKIPIIRNSHLLVLVNQFVLGERMLKFFNIKKKRHFGFAVGGYSFVIEPVNFKPEFRAFVEENLAIKDRYFKMLMKGMDAICKENNIKFMIKMTPMHYQVMPRDRFALWSQFRLKEKDYFTGFMPWLEENSIEYVNIRDKMKEVPGEYFPLNGEIHYNKEGHDFAAKYLKEALDKVGWI